MNRLSFAVITIALLALTACSKLTEANYTKLKTGMGYEEVAQVIGRADQCSKTIGLKHCVWGDAEKNISADFAADRAILFSSKNIR